MFRETLSISVEGTKESEVHIVHKISETPSTSKRRKETGLYLLMLFLLCILNNSLHDLTHLHLYVNE